jgi:hypothetical protein
MTATIKFRKFAAECQAMAKTARTAEGKASWGRLAARWMHCAEFTEQHLLPTKRPRPTRHRLAAG